MLLSLISGLLTVTHSGFTTTSSRLLSMTDTVDAANKDAVADYYSTVKCNNAMKYVVFNGSNCTLQGKFGHACELYSSQYIVEVDREEEGIYKIYYDSDHVMSDSNYVILTSSNMEGNDGAFSSIGGNSDSTSTYYGVSTQSVRISTKTVRGTEVEDSHYITVVIAPDFGEMNSMVFNEQTQTIWKNSGFKKDLKTNGPGTGEYLLEFSKYMNNSYVVLASSNTWGIDGVTSVGGSKNPYGNYGVGVDFVKLATRHFGTGKGVDSDYVSMIAGYPSGNTNLDMKYVVFDGSKCNEKNMCPIYSKNGVYEVEYNDVGIYTIKWEKEFSNNKYGILCSSNPQSDSKGAMCGFGGVDNIESHSVIIQTRSLMDGTAKDSSYISVIAFNSI